MTAQRRGLAWLRRIGVGLLVLFFALVGMGLTYQAVATEVDARSLPAPGQMVDVGGHRLHLHATGEPRGGPTVVLEAGSMFFSSQWGLIQPQIAEFARVVSYDRAGLGWSEPSGLPRDGHEVARQLHSALEKAGLSSPYVLVGHSLGGLYVRLYADRYPEDVAGLVLVDATGPELMERLSEEELNLAQGFAGTARALPYLARLGIVRLVNPFGAMTQEPPEKDALAIEADSATATYWTAAYQEQLESQFPGSASYVQARQAGGLGQVPLVVLVRTEPPDSVTRATQEARRQMASLSTNGSVRVVEGADHFSLATDPQHARAVVAAVREVVQKAGVSPESDRSPQTP